MKLIQHTSRSPEENIALGRAGRVSEECFTEECSRDGIKIIRRISGGGTVLQGPGCLNYSAVLSYDSVPGYSDIQHSYYWILQDLAKGFLKKGHNVKFYPISDLTLNGRKFSGNAQARKRRYFLHHGTILFDLDLAKVPVYLHHPKREPDHRRNRRHMDFITNILIEREDIKNVVKDIFSPMAKEWSLTEEDLERLNDLVTDKYSRENWNLAF